MLNRVRASFFTAAMLAGGSVGYGVSEQLFETVEERQARVNACARTLSGVVPMDGAIIYQLDEKCEDFESSFVMSPTRRNELLERAGPEAEPSKLEAITDTEFLADQERYQSRWAMLRRLTGLGGGVIGAFAGLFIGEVAVQIADREKREFEFFRNLNST